MLVNAGKAGRSGAEACLSCLDRHTVERPVYLVRRGEQHQGITQRAACGFKDPERAQGVGLKVSLRVVDGGGDGDLGGKMVDLGDVPGGLGDGLCIPYVALHNLQAAGGPA